MEGCFKKWYKGSGCLLRPRDPTVTYPCAVVLFGGDGTWVEDRLVWTVRRDRVGMTWGTSQDKTGPLKCESEPFTVGVLPFRGGWGAQDRSTVGERVSPPKTDSWRRGSYSEGLGPGRCLGRCRCVPGRGPRRGVDSPPLSEEVATSLTSEAVGHPGVPDRTGRKRK